MDSSKAQKNGKVLGTHSMSKVEKLPLLYPSSGTQATTKIIRTPFGNRVDVLHHKNNALSGIPFLQSSIDSFVHVLREIFLHRVE